MFGPGAGLAALLGLAVAAGPGHVRRVAGLAEPVERARRSRSGPVRARTAGWPSSGRPEAARAADALAEGAGVRAAAADRALALALALALPLALALALTLALALPLTLALALTLTLPWP